jgi:hypothetical protein
MNELERLKALVVDLGFEHLNFVIGDATAGQPDAQVIAEVDGAWRTFLRDERGVIVKRTYRTHPDQETAVAFFLYKLRNLVEIEKLDEAIAARGQAAALSPGDEQHR